MKRNSPLLVLGLLACGDLAAASGAGGQVARIAEAPVLDGRLDDAVWQRVEPIGELTQVAPEAGRPAPVATRVRLAQDGATLYVGIEALELPGYARSARQTRRDADFDGDDHVTLVLDPARAGRNGYLFRVNARGAQFDALIFDSAELRADWDAIWDARVQAVDGGWTAELAIPLHALTASGSGDWGLNVERYLAATGERLRWRGALPDREVAVLRLAGGLAGLLAHADRYHGNTRLQQ
ncbi:MAG: carbohydrate binding family 9 domain-containing protein [Cellvibrionaceae bacterium]|nr:carbohydrate binding family 9 domain-containing protein [Cellvibrionaceae bacterium]